MRIMRMLGFCAAVALPEPSSIAEEAAIASNSIMLSIAAAAALVRRPTDPPTGDQ